MKYRLLAAAGLLLLALPALGKADPSALTVPNIFGDHMVLQAGQAVPVWGWDKPGESVTVTFDGQTKTATAEPGDGAWRVDLSPLKISEKPADLTVTGTSSATFHDVLVGEVWLCSGQSNMQKPVGLWRGQPTPTLNYQQALAAANYPLIRLMNVEISNPATPQTEFDTVTRPHPDFPWEGWVACTPTSLDQIKFSAVGYYFALKLFNALHVPIGMVEATAGGTQIEAWMPLSGLESDPALADFVKAAQTPKVRFHGTSITTLYNGMINPMVPFALSGILWYQGESNLIEGDIPIYSNMEIALIKSWRAKWGQDLPFYFVQLPDLLYSARHDQVPHTPLDLPLFRKAQASALKLPNTGMVVTTDVGALHNMHPPDKAPVGVRLALWALNKVYGRTDIVPSGPLYRYGSMELEGNKAVLHFDYVGKGLASSDGKPLTSFEVAGSDGAFYPAVATISGDAVVVTSPQVPSPKVVRFSWNEADMPDPINKEGLPAAPFRTDDPFMQNGTGAT